MTIRLSDLQYPMLQAMTDGHYMSIEEAQRFDQRPFRSMLIRGWVDYAGGKGFHITPAGRKAWVDYHSRDISRKNPTLPLTSYFDPDTYRLARRDNVQVMRPSPTTKRDAGHAARAAVS